MVKFNVSGLTNGSAPLEAVAALLDLEIITAFTSKSLIKTSNLKSKEITHKVTFIVQRKMHFLTLLFNSGHVHPQLT